MEGTASFRVVRKGSASRIQEKDVDLAIGEMTDCLVRLAASPCQIGTECCSSVRRHSQKRDRAEKAEKGQSGSPRRTPGKGTEWFRLGKGQWERDRVDSLPEKGQSGFGPGKGQSGFGGFAGAGEGKGRGRGCRCEARVAPFSAGSAGAVPVLPGLCRFCRGRAGFAGAALVQRGPCRFCRGRAGSAGAVPVLPGLCRFLPGPRWFCRGCAGFAGAAPVLPGPCRFCRDSAGSLPGFAVAAQCRLCLLGGVAGRFPATSPPFWGLCK